jgi:hypothetical protein
MAVSPRFCTTVNTVSHYYYIYKLEFGAGSAFMRRAVVYTCELKRLSARVRNTRVLIHYIKGRVCTEHQKIGSEAATVFGKRNSSLV